MADIFVRIRNFARSFRSIGTTFNLARTNKLRLEALTRQTEILRSQLSGHTKNSLSDIRILLADNYFLDEANFPSLMRTLESFSASVVLGVDKTSDFGSLLSANGDYSNNLIDLEPHLSSLREMTPDELMEFKYNGVRPFGAAKHEALYCCLREDRWQSTNLIKRDAEILSRFRDTAEDWETLVRCCAASMIWTDYWLDQRKGSSEDINTYDVAILHSGFHIHSSVLIELLKQQKARCFICEPFTISGHYYFEERYHPLPNASRIGFTTVLNSYLSSKPGSENERDSRIIATNNRIAAALEKRIDNDFGCTLPKDLAGKDIYLIVGQNTADPSLISGYGEILTSLPVYKTLISRLVENDRACIVFMHDHVSYESSSSNGQDTTTTDKQLQKCVDSLPGDQRDRVSLNPRCALSSVVSDARFVITVCSEKAITAPYFGKKPITIGGAFYDVGGFTTSFRSAEEAADKILTGQVSGLVTYDEFKNFENFMAVLFQQHLISAGPDGEVALKKVFAKLPTISKWEHTQSETALSRDWEQ